MLDGIHKIHLIGIGGSGMRAIANILIQKGYDVSGSDAVSYTHLDVYKRQVVDYAHTPDGLENILQTAKAIQENRIIVVFGCGGDRDATKRPIMGRIAAQYGDVVYITSDNPRTEDPVQIVKDVEAGVKEGLREGSHYEVIVDRREAIQHAIQNAKPGDIVLIAGKGHEDYQILKYKTIHFDDREEARAALKEI